MEKGKITEFTLGIKGDERGSLIVLESGKDISFDIVRTFYIFGTHEGISRGLHAHYKTKELLISVAGSVTIVCECLGEKTIHRLDAPYKVLLLEGLVWLEMRDFSKDCVLLVLADRFYDEEDYIRDYEKFKELDAKLIENI